ncbi:MAG: ubiquinol-cytochrome c reductase cytochrome b subunit [Actinomycetota bacterium]|nr:ubiquinol-cytochrome c reductase cytochrome b subunit [Actinomycetota bacterium]
MARLEKSAGDIANEIDERFGSAKFVRRSARKVFPDHWSFMLGEIALYSFIILLLTGTFLTLWFKPSQVEVPYEGSYIPLHGLTMSEAYASTLRISFDVRGGLIMRQIHHWAALIFVAAMIVHSARVFFTGAFRKPRETNWLIGVALITLSIIEGLLGYSLPDDLLSGTGFRIAEGVLLAIPVVGTYLSFFFFGGQFPGEDFIARIYTFHVLLLPGIFLALITVHVMLVWYQKHTQYPLPGRTEKNSVGYPFFPVYTAKAGGFFFITFGVTTLLAAFVTINPVWLFGPYTPTQVTAGSQPDFYMGFLEGAFRLMPNWEIHALGYTLSMNIIVPCFIVPGLLFTSMGLYPMIERWVTGDNREHHVLDRPRNVPTRTGLGVMALTTWLILLAAGANDVIAITFHLSINAITWFFRIAIFVVPPLSYVVTKRICLGLQRRDRDLVLHGRETGRIMRLPNGEMIEVHEPISETQRYILTAHESPGPLELEPATDPNGIPRRRVLASKLRARISRFYFEDRIVPPTPTDARELESSGHH